MRKLLVLGWLIVSAVAALAQNCPVPGDAAWTAGQRWCKTMDASNASTRFLDRSWNNMVFDSGNRWFHSWFQGSDSPMTFSNAIGHYSILTGPGVVTDNKWTMDTFCGSTNSNNYATRQESMHLDADIGTGAAPFNIQLGITIAGNGAIYSKPIPQTGHVYVGDETFTYDSCTSADGTTTCLANEHGPITLHITARNQRTNAGWLSAATAHLAADSEETSLSCPGPFGIGYDHPVGVHPTSNLTYDSARGRLWFNNGYQETWHPRDTWYRCVKNTASCTDLTQGWQHVSVVASGGLPPDDVEDVTIYLPSADALLHFGGTHGGSPLNELWIFCLTANSTWVDATHTCSSAGYLNLWKKITPHGGSAFAIQAVRGTYDTTNNRALFFSGNVGGIKYPLVQVYNPVTGDWCLSTTSYGGSNASSCPSGFGTAAANPPPGQRFPAWTFDKRHGKAIYLCCAGGPNGRIYKYDAALNTWAYTDIDTANAPYLNPSIDPSANTGMDWQYADETSAGAGDDVLVALIPAVIGANTFVEMYQLPAAALDTGGTTYYTYSITIAGAGSGSVSDGAGFSCSIGTCTHNYAQGATPTFTATASGGGSFDGYSAGTGDLASCSTSPCGPVTVSQASGMTATFIPAAPASSTRLSGVTLQGITVQ